jgi:pullulanase/glycogen debranching enzyme
MAGSCDLNWEDPNITTYPGSPHPLGAYYDGHGINFALYSEYATRVYLCLFRPTHDEKHQLHEYARIRMKGIFLTEYFQTSIKMLINFFRTNSSSLAYIFT